MMCPQEIHHRVIQRIDNETGRVQKKKKKKRMTLLKPVGASILDMEYQLCFRQHAK